MPTNRRFYLWPVFWLLFYGGLLPYAGPLFLDWLSRSSDWWLGWGTVGVLGLGTGIAISLRQAGRALTYYLQHRNLPPSSFPPPHDRTAPKR